MQPHSVLVTVTGFDRPGVTSAFFAALAAHDVEVLDVEQIVVRGRLVLGVVLALHGDPGPLRRAAVHAAEALGAEVELTVSDEVDAGIGRSPHHHVIVVGRPMRAGAVGEVARRIADLGGNIDSISRLAPSPAAALELLVSGADHVRLGATLVAAARETGTDIAVERAELRRRPGRLLLLDLDGTVLRGDPLAELAALAGRRKQSSGLLARAARNHPDRAELLRERAALAAGLPESALGRVRATMRCLPAARSLLDTLKRAGYRCGVVSSGVAQVLLPLTEGLGLDLVAANTLEVAGGTLTGRMVGEVVDGAGKARALARFAEAYGVPLSQTVAVGGADGDAEMLSLSGLAVTLTSPAAVDDAALARGEAAHGDSLDPLLLMLGLTDDLSRTAAGKAGHRLAAPSR
jgi:phosphoserine phosphatase